MTPRKPKPRRATIASAELHRSARWLQAVMREDPYDDVWNDGLKFAVMHLTERADRLERAAAKTRRRK